MNQLPRWLVWVRRLRYCRGFGIQSPTDYAFVRYVLNERWPYYAYDKLETGNWLTDKLGRLYLRLANWRQPNIISSDEYRDWWLAGCRGAKFSNIVEHVELMWITVEEYDKWESLLPLCDKRSVIVVEGIYRNSNNWHAMEQDERVGTTFDLYYCGIVLFDTQRYKHHYIVNF